MIHSRHDIIRKLKRQFHLIQILLKVEAAENPCILSQIGTAHHPRDKIAALTVHHCPPPTDYRQEKDHPGKKPAAEFLVKKICCKKPKNQDQRHVTESLDHGVDKHSPELDVFKQQLVIVLPTNEMKLKTPRHDLQLAEAEAN